MKEAQTAADLVPPSSAVLSARAAGENFPVALRVLPRRYRRHLMALYRFARLVDDIGDEPPGRLLARAGTLAGEPRGQAGPAGRLHALDLVEQDLDRAFRAGATPRLPVIRDLGRTAMECAIPAQPFRMLIEANRQDQRVSRYATFEELLGYCRLSANPVGKAVLHIFGVATPERERLSDLVCTALQLAEHWQDVAEDFARGRIYLPADDMAAFGCSERDLAQAVRGPHGPPDGQRTVPPRLRMLLQFETERARRMLAEGAVLTGTLRGWARLAVAGYVAGGRATLLAIEAAGRPGRAAPPAGRTGRTWYGAAHDVIGAGRARRLGRARAAGGTGNAGRQAGGARDLLTAPAPAGFDVFGATPRPSRARTAAGLARSYVAGR